MKRKNWTNTDAQGLSATHDTGRPLFGSGLLCARLARDTRGTLPDIHLIRPARSFWGRGGWGHIRSCPWSFAILCPISIIPPKRSSRLRDCSSSLLLRHNLILDLVVCRSEESLQ
jgi:hypothetical protein